MECIMACDVSPIVQKNNFLNYGMWPMGDIRSIDPKEVGDFEVLCMCRIPMSVFFHHG